MAGYYIIGGYHRDFTIIDGNFEEFNVPNSIFTAILDMNNYGWLVGTTAVFDTDSGRYIQHGFLAKPVAAGNIDGNPGVDFLDLALLSQHTVTKN